MIGIYAPYNSSDVTTMALGLADLAITLGHGVSLFAFQSKEFGIHPEWDHKVKHDGNMLFTEWAKRCDHIVWFAFHPYRYDTAWRAKKDIISTLILLYQDLSADHVIANQIFDNVIVPSQYLCNQLGSRWSGLEPLPWDPGGPIINKDDLVDPEQVKVYIPMQSAMSDKFGPRLLYALSVVLAEFPRLNFTVARNRRLTPATAQAVNDLQSEFPGRITSMQVPKQVLRALTYREHDWTFYPAYCDDIQIPLIHSLYNGTPVVAFDSAPSVELVNSKQNGVCIRAKHPVDTELISEPSAKEIIKGLSESVADISYFRRLVTSPWPFLEQRRRNFQATWKRLWRTPMTNSTDSL